METLTQELSGTLDQILFDTPEPRRTDLLRDFMDSDDTVKLKSAHGPMTVQSKLSKRNYTFPPAGHRVSRRVAHELLWLHGRGGIYRRMDQKTGLTQARLETMPPEEHQRWSHVKISDNYIYHAETLEDDEE